MEKKEAINQIINLFNQQTDSNQQITREVLELKLLGILLKTNDNHNSKELTPQSTTYLQLKDIKIPVVKQKQLKLHSTPQEDYQEYKDILSNSLSVLNIQINPEILSKIIKLYDIIKTKKDKITLREILNIN